MHLGAPRLGAPPEKNSDRAPLKPITCLHNDTGSSLPTNDEAQLGQNMSRGGYICWDFEPLLSNRK